MIAPSPDPGRRWLAPGPRSYLLLATPFAVVFWLIPLTLYAHAGEEWDFQPVLLGALAGLGLVLYLAGAALLRLTAKASVRIARGIAILAFGLGALALLAHVYAPVAIGPLDGDALASEEPLTYSLLEAGILVAVALLCWQLLRGRGLTAASWFAALLLAVGLGYQATLSLERLSEVEAPERPLPQPPEDIDGNVYHLVLDAFQRDALQAVLEREPALREELEGFALYQNNTSNYLSTRASFASYMTGTLFRSQRYNRWLWSWRNRGLLRSLAKDGYAIWMYVPFSNWDNKWVDRLVYNVDLYEQQLGFAGSDFYDFLHVWLVSLAPTFLTNEVLEPAERGRDRVFALLIRRPPPLSPQTGVHPYAGVQMFDRLQKDERTRPDRGHYVYAHAALPHGPSVMDAECRYVGVAAGAEGDAAEKQRYLDQGACALRLATRFIGLLKELGRYDQAAIVIHSDHGRGLGLIEDTRPTMAGPQTLSFYDRQLVSSINPFLMIKRPHATGPLEVRDEPTQLIDIYPTLASLLDLPDAGHEVSGRPVDQVTRDRPAIFGFDPEVKHGPGIVEVRIEDPANLSKTRLEVLGPADRHKQGQDPEVTASAPADS